MIPCVIAVVGNSGSGKTYLTKFLQNQFDIPVIVSTTTRPKREGEINGTDYFFVRDTKDFNRDEMLTYTRFGKYEYFSMLNQLPPSGFCTYVVEENGIKALKASAGKHYNVFTVLVQCRKETLIERGIDRERIERDSNRQQVGYDLVDVVIGNNGTLEEFESGCRDLMKIVEQWQHLM